MTFTFKSIIVNTAVDTHIGLTEKQCAKVEVKKNGKPIDFEVSKYAEVEVTVCDIDYSAEYEITVTHSELSSLSLRKREALLKLQRAEGPYSVRNSLASMIKNAVSEEKLCGVILSSDISPINRIRLSETIM